MAKPGLKDNVWAEESRRVSYNSELVLLYTPARLYDNNDNEYNDNDQTLTIPSPS